MKEYKNLKRVTMEELEKLDAKYANKSEFEPKDAELYKELICDLKAHLTVEAMLGVGDDGYYASEARGRGPDGRYVSMDMGPGYDGYSGHRRMMPPYPPEYRTGW